MAKVTRVIKMPKHEGTVPSDKVRIAIREQMHSRSANRQIDVKIPPVDPPEPIADAGPSGSSYRRPDAASRFSFNLGNAPTLKPPSHKRLATNKPN